MVIFEDGVPIVITPKMPLPKVLPLVSEASQGQETRLQSGQSRDGTGKVVANRYLMGNKLGSGAFGTVFLICDLKNNRDRWGVY